MRGDEQRVIDAFCAWLKREGWKVGREVEFCDVVAERDGERLYAEAKGRTAAVGLDIDTMFGQILRRMPLADDPRSRFAAVVPLSAEKHVKRVSPRVLGLLRIEVFTVDETGAVRHSTDGAGQEAAVSSD